MRDETALGGPSDPASPVPASIWVPEVVRGEGDVEAARIADRQRGCIHRTQLRDAGLTQSAIRHRRRIGTLHPLLTDVFLFGRPRIERWGWETAAILQFPGRGVVDARSAAAMWNLVEPDARCATITLIGSDARSRPHLTIHRVGTLDPADIRRRHGLPVTSVGRTLVDCAATCTELELENALSEARRRWPIRDREILEAVDRARHKRNVAILRRLIASDVDPAATRSGYERKLLRLIRQADLPPPETNVVIERHEVDVIWRSHRLIVEFDGFIWHARRRSFETDHARDLRLQRAGYTVIRITARQLDETPHAVLAAIAIALGRAEERAA